MGRMSVNTLFMKLVVVVMMMVGDRVSACEFNCQTDSWCGSTEPVHVRKYDMMIMTVNVHNGEREFDDDAYVVSGSPHQPSRLVVMT